MRMHLFNTMHLSNLFSIRLQSSSFNLTRIQTGYLWTVTMALISCPSRLPPSDWKKKMLHTVKVCGVHTERFKTVGSNPTYSEWINIYPKFLPNQDLDHSWALLLEEVVMIWLAYLIALDTQFLVHLFDCFGRTILVVRTLCSSPASCRTVVMHAGPLWWPSMSHMYDQRYVMSCKSQFISIAILYDCDSILPWIIHRPFPFLLCSNVELPNYISLI